MNRPTDDRLLAFLEGEMPEEERAELLDALDGDAGLRARLLAAAAGDEAMRALGASTAPEARRPDRSRVPWWWIPAAVAASVLVAVPVALGLARSAPAVPGGQPVEPDPTYVLVLHGRWPDASALSPAEVGRRADEYWGWTTSLADDGLLVAAGDLAWEPGSRLGPAAVTVPVAAEEVDQEGYVVGMFALRVGTYEEALGVARACPHLRYGGSVSVRRVGGGFVTVPGMGDWTE